MDAQTAAVRLQDLFLILSQCVDLGLLPVAAPFSTTGDLKKILGSGFEMIRISQCESPRVFRIGPEWREAALQEREAKLLDIESRLKLAALMPEARLALPAVREPILTAPTLRRKKPEGFRSRKDDCVDRE